MFDFRDDDGFGTRRRRRNANRRVMRLHGSRAGGLARGRENSQGQTQRTKLRMTSCHLIDLLDRPEDSACAHCTPPPASVNATVEACPAIQTVREASAAERGLGRR
jgi:hypothetical protein